MIKLVTSSSLFALAVATSAYAQTTTPPDLNPEVSTVVVTATRIPTPKLDVADSITVITAQDIALKQQPTLPDVLQDAPGLNVVQTGGPGGQTSVFMRGTDSNHVKVLVDGIDVSDPSSPNDAFNFGQFLTPDISRVEILRGPQSGLYGSDAIGGVINIITKSGNGPAQVHAELEGGSFGTFNQNGGLSGSTGPFHYAVNIEHFQSTATPVTPLDTLAPGEKRNDDSYDNISASTKLGYDVSNIFDLGLVARYTNTDLHFTGDDDVFYGYPDPVQSQTITLQYYTRATAHLALFDGRFDQTVGVAYSSIESTDVTPETSNSYYFGDRSKVDWQGDVKIVPGETLVLGAEDERDELSQPVIASTTIKSGYAELQSTPFPNFNDTLSVRYDTNSRFGDDVTYRVAPTYFIAATGTKLEASAGTGFKAPTLSQMFQNYPAYGFYGNPNLKPETSMGYDVGFEQFLLENRLQFGVTAFYNKIKDLINDNSSFTTYINVDKAHTDGAESFISYMPIKTVTLRLDYTYTEAIDDSYQQDGAEFKELLLRPKNKWTFDARWRPTDRLSLDADMVSIGTYIDGDREFTYEGPYPGYTIWNVAAGYDLSKTLTLYGRVTNLFDKHYQDPDGFLRPTRGVYAGVKTRF